MQITWYGQSCFKIQGQRTTIVTDPFDAKKTGLKAGRGPAHIVTSSHDHFDHNAVGTIKAAAFEAPEGDAPGDGGPFVITTPGEFEVQGAFVYGVASWHDDKRGAERGPNVIYRFDVDGMTVVHLGDLGHALEASQLEVVEGADILMVPVGGTYTIDAKVASKVISQVEPRIVIPMHYALPGLKVELASLDAFRKEYGAAKGETVDKLKVVKKDLPADETRVAVLEVA